MARSVAVLVALAFAAAAECGDDERPADDGFGVPCQVDLESGQIFTPCSSLLGKDGVCVQIVTGDLAGVCRRWCEGGETNPRACPPGQTAIPIVGGLCFCEP